MSASCRGERGSIAVAYAPMLTNLPMHMSWITLLALLFAVALFLCWRALNRGEVRSFLSFREVELYRRIVYAKDSAAWRDESGDPQGADEWRELERSTRDRLRRFQTVRDRCEREKVSWQKMVRLLHAEGLYERDE